MKTYAQTVITCVAVGTLSPLTAYRTLPRIVLFPVHSFSIRFRFHKKYFASPAPQTSARRNAYKLLPTNAATPPLSAAHAGLFPVAPIPSRPSVSFHFLPYLCAAPPASSAQPRTDSPLRRSLPRSAFFPPQLLTTPLPPSALPDGRAVRDAGRPRRQTDSPFFDPVRQAGKVSAPKFRHRLRKPFS